ncbi:hypothetical protein SLA2020_445190 [Shorea laevis]
MILIHLCSSICYAVEQAGHRSGKNQLGCAIDTVHNRMGVGVIARDAEGVVGGLFVLCCSYIVDPVVAEGSSTMEGCGALF